MANKNQGVATKVYLISANVGKIFLEKVFETKLWFRESITYMKSSNTL